MIYWKVLCFSMLAAYLLLILVYWIGWILIPAHKRKPLYGSRTYTLLIPARNEASSILRCLEAVSRQKFPLERLEIIVLNDHSQDDTGSKVEQFQKQNNNLQLHLLNAEACGFRGKKEAIAFGVDRAKGDYILLTDADCTRGEHWLETIDSFLNETHAEMVYAPVTFNSSGFFEHAQSLEFAGLVGIGAAAIQLKNPNMCSAANLIFSRMAFLEVGGYTGNEHLASGDDEFLLHKIFKRYPNKVMFLKNAEAAVYTPANESMNELAQQRRRWVSKSTHYEERWITAILIGAYLFNFSIVFNLIAGIFYPGLLTVGLTQLLLKTLAESLLIGSVMRFLKRTSLTLLVPLVQPFHLIYVLVIGIWANVTTYTWKERDLK